MKLSVVIPCYNEPDTIGEIVRRVYAAALPQGIEREVIVVDDGSRQPTYDAIDAVATRYPIRANHRAINGGKGAALKDGFRAATGDYVIVQDADLEYDPNDYHKLLDEVIAGRAETVFGARQREQNNVAGRFVFYLGGKIINDFFNVVFGTKLTDLSTCYKLFPRTLIPELLMQPSNDFVFDVIELSVVMSKKKLVEVPISYHPRTTEEGKKIRAKDGIRCLLGIVSIRFAKHARIAKFIVVGGTAMVVNILALYIFTSLIGLWYLASSVISFLLALAYNFMLQRLWTFDGSTGSSKRQFPLFFAVNVLNLALNTAILYALVEWVGIWYLFAQIIASGLIAFESFFVYRAIFR